MKNKVIEAIRTVLIKNNFDDFQVQLTPSKKNGDFSTNIAMQLAKISKTSPQELAKKLSKELENEIFIKKVEVAGPGFINIFLSNDAQIQIVKNILKQDQKYGENFQKKYINVEYVSANPTGYLHLGHARGAALGSTLVNILRFAGNKVDAEYYVNDAGNQIKVLGESVYIRYQNLFDQNLAMPDESYKGIDIIKCAQHLKEMIKEKYKNIDYKKCKLFFEKNSKEYFLSMIQKHLGQYNVKMSLYSSEKDQYALDQISKTLKKISIHTFLKDGALWLETISKGDDKNRVLMKSDQKYTYLTPDIAYHDQKLSRGYDELINIWGGDHIGYIKRMKIALEYLGFSPEKLDILIVQTVRLIKNNLEFKMSKRKGAVYSLEELIQEVGVDSARWFMLDRSSDSQFLFDIDVAKLKTSDNPVFTIQYTHARINQLLKKSSHNEFQSLIYGTKEREIISQLAKFPDVIKMISSTHKVQLLPQYLITLSSLFNSWYSNHKIIGSDKEGIMLDVAKATQIVIKNGLKLLGIKAPLKM